MSGLMSHAQGHFAYNAAKGATVHLGKMMSAEFEKLGVRVNQIAPGYFPTEMTMGGSDENQKTQMPHEKVQEKRHVPAERPGSEEEMAQAVVGDCFFGRLNSSMVVQFCWKRCQARTKEAVSCKIKLTLLSSAPISSGASPG